MIVSIILMLSVAFADAGPTPKRCPNGFRYVNGDTSNVMYDDRDIKTCKLQGFDSCVKIQYDYQTPEVPIVQAEWDMPCFNPRKLPSFDLNTLFPEAALPLDINLQVCMGDDCVDFTPQADIDLFCYRGVVVIDHTDDAVLVEDLTKAQCKTHQTGCYTMTQTFEQDGKSATRIVGDCYDEWRSYDFIWDNFYPYTDFSGGYCEKFGCIAFKVWHKDAFDTRACYCTGDNKPPGTYGKPTIDSCTGDMCNSKEWWTANGDHDHDH